MKNCNIKPIYKQVRSDLIVTDTTYQRPINVKRVKEIVKDFNPALVNPIKLSYRDGKYYVFDGQHTLAALKQMNGGKDLAVLCAIYKGLTQQDEAFLFSQQTGASQAVYSEYKLRALYIAEDERTKDMYDIVTSLGFKFDFTKVQAPKKIVAVATLWRIYQQSNREEFTDILEIIRNAWDFNPNSLKKEILGGIHCFYTYPDYKDIICKGKLVQKLSREDPFIIIRDSKKYSNKGDKRYARTIAELYNKGLRKGRLPHEMYI